MTKLGQEQILYQLNFLKSIGYQYYEDIGVTKRISHDLELPNSFSSLESITKNCHLCQLSKYRANTLFGQGNIKAKVMFIGDEPSISEDELGEFFVGKSGVMLARMIENVLNINKNDVYITNIVKCRTSHNTINVEEANCCRAYLDKQVSLIQPELIVLLGEVAYDFFLDNQMPFSQIRGQIINKNSFNIISTFHPSYLLRNPSVKKEAYFDMLKIKSFLEK